MAMMKQYYDKLGGYDGKLIKITTDDGQIFEGLGVDYTSRLDNPDGIASICIGDYELYENEIASIELVHANVPVMAEAI
jgi:hypothetical protein